MEERPRRAPALIPELDVTDLAASTAFYRLLGFEVVYDRPAEAFAYLALGSAQLMLQRADGPGRRFRTAALEPPYGRGVNLQIEVDDLDPVEHRLAAAGIPLLVPREDRWYGIGTVEAGNRQLVVEDPDGYLLRLFQNLGTRPRPGSPHAPT